MIDKERFRIGVVIVNYNSGEFLSLCLRSLVNSHAPLDVVVVDNDSHDQSLESIERILSGSHKLKLIRNQKNVGFSKAVNQGMLELRNRYVVMLNPDCTIFPHTFLRLQSVMVASKKVAVAGAAIFNNDGSEQRGCRRNEPTLRRSAVTALGLGRKYEGIDLSGTPYPSHPLPVDAVSGAAMMVRRDYFDEIGGMDEDYFLHCEDLDICRRFRDEGYEITFCPDASVFHHQGASSGVTSNEVEKHKHDGMLIYNNKHSDESGLKIGLIYCLVKGHYFFGIVLNWAKMAVWSRLQKGDLTPQGYAEFNSLDITHNTRPVVIVTGAKSDVGDYLLKRLSENGFQVFAVSRNEVPDNSPRHHIAWLKLEYFQKCSPEDFGELFAWINLAPVWTTRPLAKVFHKFKPRKIIALSSTSVEGKSESEHQKDIDVVTKLFEGEKWLSHYSEKYEIDCTILRPTLVYGGPRNQNVNFLKQLIKVFRVFPLVGSGDGKRQPIHADDIAITCIRSLKKEIEQKSKIYNITGGDTLTYREMVDQIFETLSIQPRYLRIPLTVVRPVMNVASKVPGLDFLNSEMAERTEQDLVYSITPAVEELQFSPRKFDP